MTQSRPDMEVIFDPRTYAQGVPYKVFDRLRHQSLVVWVEEKPVLNWQTGPGYWPCCQPRPGRFPRSAPLRHWVVPKRASELRQRRAYVSRRLAGPVADAGDLRRNPRPTGRTGACRIASTPRLELPAGPQATAGPLEKGDTPRSRLTCK